MLNALEALKALYENHELVFEINKGHYPQLVWGDGQPLIRDFHGNLGSLSIHRLVNSDGSPVEWELIEGGKV